MSDIMQMTPEELRSAIAKAKGIIRIESYCSLDDDGMIWAKRMDDGSNSGYEAYQQVIIPNWPTSLAAAWELVEEMADQGDLFIESWQDGEWFIANHPLTIKPRGLARCDGKTTGKRDICLAICRAWLAWNDGTNRYDMGG